MKAVQINSFGDNDVVEINKNVPVPVAGPGQLLIQVQAAGVNPIDWKIRAGYMPQISQFPITLGRDFSGVVTKVGKGVSGFQKGDAVYGQASDIKNGTFAEFIAVDTKTCTFKPKSLDHVEAGALPLAGVSAWQALVDQLALSRSKKILIHGGAGGIGSIAIQLAKHLGATVATTVRAEDIDYVKELGADLAIDYQNQSFSDMIHDYDAVFDTVGGETFKKSIAVLKKGGRIVSMLERAAAESTGNNGVIADYQFTKVNSERLSRLADLVDQGAIKIHIDKIFPLEQAGEALAYMQKAHKRGKIVLMLG